MSAAASPGCGGTRLVWISVSSRSSASKIRAGSSARGSASAGYGGGAGGGAPMCRTTYRCASHTARGRHGGGSERRLRRSMPGEAFAADAAAAGEVEAVTPELSGFAITGDDDAMSGRSGRTGLLVRDMPAFRRSSALVLALAA